MLRCTRCPTLFRVYTVTDTGREAGSLTLKLTRA